MPDFDISDRACALHKSVEGFSSPGAEKHYPPDLEVEPVHLDIAATVDLESETLDGSVTLTVEGRKAGADQLALHAVSFEGLRVSDSDERPITWQYDGKV